MNGERVLTIKRCFECPKIKWVIPTTEGELATIICAECKEEIKNWEDVLPDCPLPVIDDIYSYDYVL